MKKINLEEILKEHSSILDEYPCPYPGVLKAMREFGKQLLILAADNATWTMNKYSISINRKSITDTINQVE